MKNKSSNKSKRFLLTLAIISVGILFYITYPFSSRILKESKSSNSTEIGNKMTKVEREKPIPPLEVKKQERKKNEDEKTIHDLAREYKRDELELLKNTSRVGLDPRLVNEFIKRSRLIKSRELQLEVAKEMSGNNLPLSLEFVRFTNKKFPQEKVQAPKAPGKPFKPKDVFKSIKKE